MAKVSLKKQYPPIFYSNTFTSEWRMMWYTWEPWCILSNVGYLWSRWTILQPQQTKNILICITKQKFNLKKIFFSRVWTLLVCTSRMYLGMHSLGDVVAGLILSGVLLPPTLAFVHVSDKFFLQHPLSPLLVLTITLTAIFIFPCPSTWSPSAVTAIDVLACYQVPKSRLFEKKLKNTH